MTVSARITVEGDALARVAHNALIFIPARAKDVFIRVVITSDRIEFGGTDGYACGTDNAPIHNGPGHPVSFALSRDDLTDLEATARRGKKLPLSLALTESALTLSGEGLEPLSLTPLPVMREAWTILDAAFARTKAEGGPPPEFVAWDWSLASRFAKVKADPDRVADCWFRGAEQPILVKIGPTFRGLLMPVYRKPAQEYSPDGLW